MSEKLTGRKMVIAEMQKAFDNWDKNITAGLNPIAIQDLDFWIRELKKDTIKEPIFSENYPVTFDDKGMRAFIQENFEEHFKGIVPTDEELDQFKRHLEASLSDWISENWRDFTQNRGD